MEINLAKSAGFCFGVKRALSIAFKTVAENANVFILTDIVHNEDVARELKQSGIKKIKKLQKGKDKILLIPAHGAAIDTIKKACKLGYKIIDATCPMVKQIHRIAQGMEEKGYQIIIIGDKKHAEVRGITGQLKNKVIVIDALKNIPLQTVRKIKKAAIIVQSTQNLEKIFEIVRALKRCIKDLRFFNTICNPTRTKQKEIKTMPLKNGLMLIIGSKNSANTKRLYEIAKALNKKSYWISSRKEINPRWFKGVKRIGITAGASTPESTTQDVIQHIKQFQKSRVIPS